MSNYFVDPSLPLHLQDAAQIRKSGTPEQVEELNAHIVSGVRRDIQSQKDDSHVLFGALFVYFILAVIILHFGWKLISPHL